MDVHVNEQLHLAVAWICPPHVCAKGHLPAIGIGGVGEVVVAKGVGTERRVVVVGRKRQRSAARPAAHELRRQKLPILISLGVRTQEAVERPDSRLVFAQPDVCAVPSKDIRLRRGQGYAGLAGIAQDELAGLDGSALAGQRLDAAALDRGLTDRVPVPQWVQVARLGAEVLRGHNRESRSIPRSAPVRFPSCAATCPRTR